MTNLREYDKLRKASPFVPFTIVMSDGARFEVPHPEFTWRTPLGGLVFVVDDSHDAASLVDPLHITRFEISKARKGKK